MDYYGHRWSVGGEKGKDGRVSWYVAGKYGRKVAKDIASIELAQQVAATPELVRELQRRIYQLESIYDLLIDATDRNEAVRRVTRWLDTWASRDFQSRALEAIGGRTRMGRAEEIPAAQGPGKKATSWNPSNGFIIVDYRWLDAGLSPAEALVYGYLNSFESTKETKGAWPSRRKIGERLKLSSSTVDRTLKKLREMGAIETLSRFDDDGRQRSNLYRCTPSFFVPRVRQNGDLPLPQNGDHTKTRSTNYPPSEGSAPARRQDDTPSVADVRKRWWKVYADTFFERYDVQPQFFRQHSQNLESAIRAGTLDGEDPEKVIPLVFDHLDEFARRKGAAPGTVHSLTAVLNNMAAAKIEARDGAKDPFAEKVEKDAQDTQAYLDQFRSYGEGGAA